MKQNNFNRTIVECRQENKGDLNFANFILIEPQWNVDAFDMYIVDFVREF